MNVWRRISAMSGACLAVLSGLGFAAPCAGGDPPKAVPAGSHPPASTRTCNGPKLDAVAVAQSTVTVSGALAGKPTVLSPITVPLMFNGKYLGDIDAAVDFAGNGEIDAARLLDLVRPILSPETLAALETRIGARRRVSIAALSIPGFTLVFDSSNLEIRLNAGIDRLGVQGMPLSGARPPDFTSYEKAANYVAGVNAGFDQAFLLNGPKRGRQPLAIDLDGYATIGGFDGVNLISGARWTESLRPSTWQRRESLIVKDFFDAATRAKAGEFRPSVSGLQTSNRVLGAEFARDYLGIRPFQNVQPSGRGEFVLERDATVIVQVNGIEVDRLRLAPGRYSLSQFPLATASNNVRIEVEDSAGLREISTFDLFNDNALLDPSLTDFGLSAGWREQDKPFDYSGPFTASGYVRRGLTNWFTAGMNGQISDGAIQAGGEFVFGSQLGLIRFLAAYSHDRSGEDGHAFAADWRGTWSVISDNDFSITATATNRSLRFHSVFDRPDLTNAERWGGSFQAQWSFRNFAAGAGYHFSDARTGKSNQGGDVSLSASLGAFSANLILGMDETAGKAGERAAVSITIRLGSRESLQTRYDSTRRSYVAEARRFERDQLDDLSGSIRAEHDQRNDRVAAELTYLSNRFTAHGEQNVSYAHVPNGQNDRESRLQLGTFIGFADGAAAIGRPARTGFVIVPRHETLDGSEVSITRDSGEVVAEHDTMGPALVPLRSQYSPESFMVNVDPIPDGYDIGDGVIRVFPGELNGFKAMVGSAASRVVVGKLVGPDGPVVNVSGTVVSVDDPAFKPRPFFTNLKGRFVADRLAPGRYRLMLGDKSAGEFSISENQKGTVDAGEIKILP